MGILDNIFKRQKLQGVKEHLDIFNAYSPVFSTYSGGIYELDLTRTAVHTISTHRSKLNIVIKGSAYRNLEKKLQIAPNEFMTLSQFMYKLSTIFEIENNAFIIPLYDIKGDIIGIYPISTIGSSLVNINERVYLKYLVNGKKRAIEYDKVGHMKKMQYRSDFYGESNAPINTTLEMLDTQNQAIKIGVKNSAMIRFIGKISNTYKAKELADERNRLAEENFSMENTSGVLLIDNKYSEFKQIEPKTFVVNPKQQELIQDNVQNYFGVSMDILQNKASEDVWNSFYEGSVEPFAIQLSQVLMKMLFTDKELSYDNAIVCESNKLQFMSPKTKIEMINNLFDRGMLTHNQGLEILNMRHVEGGDKRFIRGEYLDVDEVAKRLLENNVDENATEKKEGGINDGDK